MRRADLISGVLFFALSLYAGYLSYDLEVGTLSSPEAGFLPLLVSVLLFCSSCIFIFCSVRKKEDGPAEAEAAKGSFWIPGLFFILLSAAYLVILRLVGFWVDTFLILTVLHRLSGGQTLWRSFLFSLTSIVLSYFLFALLLKCEFPPGVLFEDVIWRFIPTF